MKSSFLLKWAEIFGLLLVVIGLSQLSDWAGEWQFNIVSDGTKSLVAFGGLTILSLGLAYLWQRWGRGAHWHIWIQGIIAFYVAYEISVYGVSKIMKTQLQAPHFVLETPMSELSGFWQTWAYFGYSQTLALIVGSIQVGGSILLLFRKTRLIGAFILLPVLMQINLINHFYDISPLAYYNALHYTAILLFFMLLDFNKLKAAFLSHRETMSLNWKMLALNIARIAVIGAAFYYINHWKHTFQVKTKLNGVWQVESLTQNQRTFLPTVSQDSIWSKIYFEWRYGCVFKYHPDKFQAHDLNGAYKVDETQQTVKINFAPKDTMPADSAFFHYQIKGDSLLTLNGVKGKDSIVVFLKRLKS
jgi:hypothetical protein